MQGSPDREAAVAMVAKQYYAAMLGADGDRLKDIFHPMAIIVGHFGGELEQSTLEAFIASTPDARTGEGPFECRVDNMVLVGDIAVITLGGYSYGHWFSDHLSLVEIEGQWRIVSKTFFCHPGKGEGH